MTTQRTTAPSLKMLAAAAAVALLAACGSGGESSDAADDAASPAGGLSPVCVQKEDLTYDGEDGETALDLLLEHDSTAETTGDGDDAFVTGICGYTAQEGDSEFWALYVDGEQATMGAGALETEDGQEITWKLETF
ncbi:DUF4430 domain-containing protein [Myceligenerans cantabricum]